MNTTPFILLIIWLLVLVLLPRVLTYMGYSKEPYDDYKEGRKYYVPRARRAVLEGKRKNGEVFYDELDYLSPGEDFFEDETKPQPRAYELD